MKRIRDHADVDGDEMTMWSPPLVIKDIRELALGSGSAVRGAPTITSGTIRPTLLIVGPPYSAVIVSGDTIFEQRLVAAPTATVRTSPSRSCLRRNAAGWPCGRQLSRATRCRSDAPELVQ
jgi:hypothetical protein